MKGVFYIAGLLLLWAALPAHGHLLNMTEMSLQAAEDGSATFEVRIDLGQSLMTPEAYWRAATAGGRDDQERHLEAAVATLVDGVSVTADGHRAKLTLRDWRLEAVSPEAIRNPLTPQMATLVFDVNTSAAAAIEVSLAQSLQVPWPCLLRVDIPGVELPVSRLLTDGTRSSRPVAMWRGANPGNASMLVELTSSFQAVVPAITWLAVGFQHIIPRGLDHIVFLLGLFFLSSRFSTLLWQVSCFTLAHSLTLGLATFGLIQVPVTVVEPLIAASIIYVAVDNLYSERLARWRLLVVTVFGLLHGLGFASALGDVHVPEDTFLLSLAMFNVGVELGQLVVLALAFLVVGWLRHWSAYQARVAQPASVTIAGVGLYWLLKRLAF